MVCAYHNMSELHLAVQARVLSMHAVRSEFHFAIQTSAPAADQKLDLNALADL